mmetsp:Transcript_16530/g.29443  ORF Transcript_16530/g.29443 Transcript_16530/m.29443 type:complete len:283 (-) Transcript_16530:1103-1951(-)
MIHGQKFVVGVHVCLLGFDLQAQQRAFLHLYRDVHSKVPPLEYGVHALYLDLVVVVIPTPQNRGLEEVGHLPDWMNLSPLVGVGPLVDLSALELHKPWYLDIQRLVCVVGRDVHHVVDRAGLSVATRSAPVDLLQVATRLPTVSRLPLDRPTVLLSAPTALQGAPGLLPGTHNAVDRRRGALASGCVGLVGRPRRVVRPTILATSAHLFVPIRKCALAAGGGRLRVAVDAVRHRVRCALIIGPAELSGSAVVVGAVVALAPRVTILGHRQRLAVATRAIPHN